MKQFVIALMLCVVGAIPAADSVVSDQKSGIRPNLANPDSATPTPPATVYGQWVVSSGTASRGGTLVFNSRPASDVHQFVSAETYVLTTGEYTLSEQAQNASSVTIYSRQLHAYRPTMLPDDSPVAPGPSPCTRSEGGYDDRLTCARDLSSHGVNNAQETVSPTMRDFPGNGRESQSAVPMSLELQHSFRYHQMDERGSFGAGVLCNYDSNLMLSSDANHNISSVEWYDARGGVGFLCTPSGPAGTFANVSHGRVQSLTVLNGSSVLTSSLTAAVTAVITYWDGTSQTYEIFSLGSDQVRCGRLTKITDRPGNITTISYTYAVSSSLATLGYDLTRLWQIAKVTDPAGRLASFTYAWQDGAWVVTSIVFPDTTTHTYGYGHGYLLGVDTITYPGGDQSTFTTHYDAGDQTQVVDAVEVSLAGQRQALSYYVSPSQNDSGPCAPNRIRMVTNPQGEIVHASWIEHTAPDGTGADTHTYVFQGGGTVAGIGASPAGTLLRLDTINGVPTASQRSTSWNILQPTSTYTMETVERVTYNASRQLTGRVLMNGTANGLQETYALAASGVPQSMTLSQDGTTICSWSDLLNQFQLQTVETDPNGHIANHSYDTVGNLSDATEAVNLPEQGTRRWTYNTRGQVLTFADEQNNITTYTYLTNGDLQKCLDPPDRQGDVQALWQWTYDSAGRVLTSTDPQNRVTTHHYDARGRTDLVTYADSTTYAVTYGTGAQANLVLQTVDRVGHTTQYGYDGSGRRTSIITGAEHPATQILETITYVPGTNLEATHAGGGRYIEYQYDYRLRRVATITHASSSSALTESIVYDGCDRIDHTVDAYGRRTYLGYDNRNRVIRRVQELVVGGLGAQPPPVASVTRVTTSNPPFVVEDTEYDLAGNVVAQVDGRGMRTELHRDGRDRVYERHEAVGATDGTAEAVIKTQYNAANDVQMVTSPAGRMVYATYGGRNLPLTRTDGYGTTDAGTTTYVYTGMGEVLSHTDPNGHMTTLGYGLSCDLPTSATDPLLQVTQYGRDGLGQLTSLVDPDTHQVMRDYDALGRLLHDQKVNGSVTETTTMVFDDVLGDGVGLDAAGTPVASRVSGLGLGAQTIGGVTVYLGTAVAATDPLGNTSYSVLDGAGRIVCAIDARGKVSTVSYDAVVNGLVETAATDALGHTTRAHMDAAGQKRELVDALGKTSTAAYDPQGNLTRMRDANGTGMDAVYDLRGRRLGVATTRTSGPIQSVTNTYDLDGNLLTELNSLPGSSAVINAYDARNRLTSTTDRIHAVTTFNYDAVGNRIQMTDADGGGTAYAYTVRNELQSEVFPGPTGGSRSYTYYPGGTIKTRTDQRGIVTTYTYDGVNRLLNRSFSDSAADVFTYDLDGRVLSAASGRYGTTVARQYLASGLLDHETLTWPVGIGGTATTTTVQYGYDDADRTISVTYPDGQVLSRGFTNRNELQTLTFAGQSLVTSASYDDGGRRTTMSVGNGLGETRSWDNTLLTHVVVKPTSGAAAVDLSYDYDANYRKKYENDGVVSGNNQTFAYDDADRVTGWTGSGGASRSWVLSPVGDWTSTTTNGVVQSRTHTPVHEISAINSVSLQNDANGNVTQTDVGQRLSWDDENHLLTADAVPNADGVHGQALYTYDAFGRRVAKKVFGTTTLIVYDGMQMIQEIDTPSQLPGSAVADDGSLATLAQTPDGALIPSNGSGAQPIRINFQPATVDIPAGYLADKGKVYGVRSNGMSYGWLAYNLVGVIRNFHPLPQYDTFQHMSTPTAGWEWQIALPNGTYPVAVVCGDATSIAHTDSIFIGSQSFMDATPGDASSVPSYQLGNFDLYTQQVTVTNGMLMIVAAAGTYDPTMCFLEIGVQGTTFTQTQINAMQAQVAAATARTGGAPFGNGGNSETRSYVWGSYVDEALAMQRKTIAGSAYYWVHNNAQFSPQALTDISGAVVERYVYDSHGGQVVQSPLGATLAKSAVNFHYGFTGYGVDYESGLLNARTRQYSPALGRFVNRDADYMDGASLYNAYFVPNGTDPTGQWGGIHDIEDAFRHAASGVNDHVKKVTRRFMGDVHNISEAVHEMSGLMRDYGDPLIKAGLKSIGNEVDDEIQTMQGRVDNSALVRDVREQAAMFRDDASVIAPFYERARRSLRASVDQFGRRLDRVDWQAKGRSFLNEAESIYILGPFSFSYTETAALAADTMGKNGNKIRRGSIGAAGAIAVGGLIAFGEKSALTSAFDHFGITFPTTRMNHKLYLPIALPVLSVLSMAWSAHDGYLKGKDAPNINVALVNGGITQINSTIHQINFILADPYTLINFQFAALMGRPGISIGHINDVNYISNDE